MKPERVILDGGDYTVTLKVLLSHITQDVGQAYHEFMYVIVESFRFRDRAITEIVMMVHNLDKTLESQYTPMRDPIVKLVRDLAMSLYFQAEEHRLYNERSMLMYTYYRHPDLTFDDVVLTNIIPLEWNGRFYEPPIL